MQATSSAGFIIRSYLVATCSERVIGALTTAWANNEEGLVRSDVLVDDQTNNIPRRHSFQEFWVACGFQGSWSNNMLLRAWLGWYFLVSLICLLQVLWVCWEPSDFIGVHWFNHCFVLGRIYLLSLSSSRETALIRHVQQGCTAWCLLGLEMFPPPKQISSLKVLLRCSCVCWLGRW